MVKLHQHVPAFVNDGDGGWVIEAPTLKKLLTDPRVAVYASDVEPVERPGRVIGWVGPERRKVTVNVIYPAPEEQRFHQWSRSDRDMLIVEHNHGDQFWVVGYLSGDAAEIASLPTWKETETARIRREAWNRGDAGPAPKPYRCAEHGVDDAQCCLPNKNKKSAVHV